MVLWFWYFIFIMVGMEIFGDLIKTSNSANGTVDCGNPLLNGTLFAQYFFYFFFILIFKIIRLDLCIVKITLTQLQMESSLFSIY